MANITTIEPIRYAQSGLSKTVTGLLTTKPGTGVNLSDLIAVDGFEVTGTQPVGTARRAAFLLNDLWHRVNPDGSLEELMEQTISADGVLAEGNTVAELEAITSVPAFLNREIGVAIALSAPSPDAAMPTMGLGIKGTTATPVTETVQLSPLYELAPESMIIKLEAKTKTESGGTVTVEARITDIDGILGDWEPLKNFNGRKANSVQFRTTCSVTQIGVSLAEVSQVSMQYRSGDDIVSGVGVAELVSVTKDWYDGIGDCRTTVRHAPLIDAKLAAFCALRDKASIVKGEKLGSGSGERKTFQLAHTNGIEFGSIAVYVDGVRIMAGIDVNTEVGRVTFTPPEGAIVTADYIYGWTKEVWTPMHESKKLTTPTYDMTEWKLLVSANEMEKSICAVKYGLEMTEGDATDEELGVGMGRTYTYTLAHAVKEGEISVFADGVLLSPDNWTILDGNKTLRIAAPLGVKVTVTYNWISETPTMSQFVAVYG